MPFALEIVHRDADAAYWDGQAIDVGTLVNGAGATALGCHRLTMEFTRVVPAGARDDKMNATLHIAHHPGAHLFARIPDAATFALAEARLDTWWTAAKAYCNDQVTLTAYRWHPVDANEFDVDDNGQRYDKLGPAQRVTTRSVAGTAAAARQPDQVASTITFRTPSRKHWGRIYLPGWSGGAMNDSTGRIASPTPIDTSVNAMRTLALGLATDSLELGVWSPRGRAFLTFKELRMDDVPDIQRRRRAKTVTYAKTVAS